MPIEETELPKEFPISKKVRALVGFRDDRVEIKVKTGIPLVGEITLDLERGDLEAVEKVVNAQKAWLKNAKIERELRGAE